MAQRNGRTGGPVRMEDVARRVGVSLMTVSRAIYKPHKVAEKTRQRILRAVEEMGYVPNLVAGGLASARTKVIAVIVPTVSNPVYGRIVHGLSRVVASHGYHLVLGGSGFSPREEESLVATLLARRPDGILLHSTRHTPHTRRLLRRAGIPIVETGGLVSRPLDMTVSYSNFEAAMAMTMYLLERGYRRIGFVSAPVGENERASERRRGYESALRQHGVPVNPALVLEASLSFHEGARTLCDLMAREPHLDAVFYTGDVWAVGALFECSRRGWSVPRKVAIAGFDDQEIATECVPKLTTVRVAREEIGRRAGQMLLDRVSGKPVAERTVDMGFEIVARESACIGGRP